MDFLGHICNSVCSLQEEMSILNQVSAGEKKELGSGPINYCFDWWSFQKWRKQEVLPCGNPIQTWREAI